MPKNLLNNLIKRGVGYLSKKEFDIPSEIIEDIVSEVVEKLNGNSTFQELIRKNRGKAYSYFYRALYNRSINYLKRENKDLPLKVWAKTTLKDPLFYAIMVESEHKSYDLVDELLSDRKMRRDLFLVYLLNYKDLTLETLGWMVNLSKSTVEYRVKKTIKKIDNTLSSKGFIYIFQYKIFFRILFRKIVDFEFDNMVSGWNVA